MNLFIFSAAQNPKILSKLETILQRWVSCMQLILNEAEQIRREADDVGPSEELTYWRKRMTCLNAYYWFLELYMNLRA